MGNVSFYVWNFSSCSSRTCIKYSSFLIQDVLMNWDYCVLTEKTTSKWLHMGCHSHSTSPFIAIRIRKKLFPATSMIWKMQKYLRSSIVVFEELQMVNIFFIEVVCYSKPPFQKPMFFLVASCTFQMRLCEGWGWSFYLKTVGNN